MNVLMFDYTLCPHHIQYGFSVNDMEKGGIPHGLHRVGNLFSVKNKLSLQWNFPTQKRTWNLNKDRNIYSCFMVWGSYAVSFLWAEVEISVRLLRVSIGW